MTETDLQHSILGALARIGAWAWRVNAGSRGGVRMAPEGTPDICVVHPHGWIEVKRPGEKLRPSQERWHKIARDLGVRCITATSVTEAVREVRRWQREDLGGET